MFLEKQRYLRPFIGELCSFCFVQLIVLACGLYLLLCRGKVWLFILSVGFIVYSVMKNFRGIVLFTLSVVKDMVRDDFTVYEVHIDKIEMMGSTGYRNTFINFHDWPPVGRSYYRLCSTDIHEGTAYQFICSVKPWVDPAETAVITAGRRSSAVQNIVVQE